MGFFSYSAELQDTNPLNYSWILIILVSHLVVSIEERGLIDAFGEDYEKYRKYVPALLPYKGAGGKRLTD